MERKSYLLSSSEPVSHRLVVALIWALAIGGAVYTVSLLPNDATSGMLIGVLVITLCALDIRRDVKKIREKIEKG